MHDWFYERQHQLELIDLEEHAQALDLDVDRWKNEWRDRRYRDRVREDAESGRASGVTGTPTFFINSVRYDGPHDFESMLAAISSAALAS